MNNHIVSGTIYALHNGDGIPQYVGYTILTPEERLKTHKRDSKNPKINHRDVYVWINEIGIDRVCMDVLEYYPDIPSRDIRMREIAAIADLRDKGLTLKNGTAGGNGAPGAVRSLATRKKISDARTGQVAHNKGKPMSEGQKALISESLRGHNHTAESKQKMSEQRKGNAYSKGYKQSPEHIAKRLESIRKKKELERQVNNHVALDYSV